MTKVPVLCVEEKKIVGHMEVVGQKAVKLDGPTILRIFIPVANEYRLQSVASRGRPLICPKCHNILSISGTITTFESNKSMTVDDVAIIVGITKVGVQ